jgi:flagellar biosynthesis chaperone FliJ
MNKREAYKQKLEAKMELEQSKLAELKAKLESSAADVRYQYAKQVDDLEQTVDDVKRKLKELDEAGEDAWEKLKDGVESAWETLSTAVKDASAKFK